MAGLETDRMTGRAGTRHRALLGTMTAALTALAGVSFAQAAESAGAPRSLSRLLEDYAAVAPAERGAPSRDRALRIGNLELLFEEGVLFDLRSGNGEALGHYFTGRGRYTYRSEDPADRLVIETNVSREMAGRLYFNHAVRDTFERAVLFFAAPGSRGDRSAGSSDVPEIPLPTADGERFLKIWNRIRETYLPYDHLAAEARINGGERQYVYVEMEGGRETAGYSFDRGLDFEERLFLFRKVQGFDVRFQRPLSVQPIDGGAAAHSGPLILKDVRLEIATEDNRHAVIRSDLTLHATEAGLRVLRFGLTNNRDPRHFDWASPRNRLEVVAVTDAGGTPLTFSHRYHELLVQLQTPPVPGEPFRLTVETRGDILTDMRSERNDNLFHLLGTDWYPVPGGSAPRGHTFSLKVRARKPYVTVAPGRVLSRRDTGDFTEIETASSWPVGRVALFAGTYVSRDEKFGSRTIHVHAYASALQRVLEAMPRLTERFLRFYERTLGPYPFGDLAVVEVPLQYEFDTGRLYAFGIAPPGMVILTSEAYNARRDFGSAVMSRGVNNRLAHELAHQWFPHRAMPATGRDAWLSESLAEYVSGLAMAAADPDQRDVQGFPQMFALWRQESRLCTDLAIEAANMLAGPGAPDKRRCLLYSRGPLVLHMLRAMAGEDRFFAVLRRYLEEGSHGPVTTDDFQRAAEEVLGTDLGWFFDDWVRKGGVPTIQVEFAVKAAPAGAILEGKAEQAEGGSFRRILIPLVLDLDGGRREVRLVFQDRPVKDFRFVLTEMPKKVTVDPGRNNLAAYR